MWSSRVSRPVLSIVMWVLAMLLMSTPAAGLQCYSCQRTSGQSSDANSENIDCLVNSTETSCLAFQDRCYSYLSAENSVEKGCTKAENCIGNRICCQTDFCNAGYGSNLKTGFGQPCEREASCVQDEGMVCRRELTAANQLSRCLCAAGWFPLGAACLQKSGVGGVCYEDSHCRLANSYCQYRRCRCAQDFFPNDTQQACLLKLPIMSQCESSQQCRARNSMCLERCVCDMGYLFEELSGHCSGAIGMLLMTGQWAVVLMTVLMMVM